jgi:predicted dehydrogenase
VKYRASILSADHYHVPQYVDACVAMADRVQIVALSGMGITAREIAEKTSAERYDHWDELLDREKVDFVLVFGTNREAPRILSEVVARGVPFITEKPCAIHAEDLVPIIATLKEKDLPHLVALWRRYSPIPVRYRDTIREAAVSGGVHLSFRYITGGPHRYARQHCEWVNDPHESGGGFLIVDGSHYIDLTRYLTGQEIVDATGKLNSRIWNLSRMEDYATVLLETANGCTATLEIGFTNPGKPYERIEVGSKDFYIEGETGKKARVLRADGLADEFDLPLGNMYDRNVADMVAMLDGKECPDAATLEDQYKCLKVINEVYESCGVVYE